jgi:formylglycine-generating enzyme
MLIKEPIQSVGVVSRAPSRLELWNGIESRLGGPHVIENSKDRSLLVLVPSGKFLAGDPPFDLELPAFYLGLTCVTNRQYQRFVRETGHRAPDKADYGVPVWKGGAFPSEVAEHPVVCVSWEDARAYSGWAGLRLPSELEWEKGARYLDGRKYPWGGDWDEAKCRNDKSKVNGKRAGVWDYAAGGSEWGGYQLSGNVWEWCADWYDAKAYEQYRQGGLKPPEGGSTRVVRGGSWDSANPDLFAASSRISFGPEDRNYYYGFRCAMDAVRSPRAGD